MRPPSDTGRFTRFSTPSLFVLHTNEETHPGSPQRHRRPVRLYAERSKNDLELLLQDQIRLVRSPHGRGVLQRLGSYGYSCLRLRQSHAAHRSALRQSPDQKCSKCPKKYWAACSTYRRKQSVLTHLYDWTTGPSCNDVATGSALEEAPSSEG